MLQGCHARHPALIWHAMPVSVMPEQYFHSQLWCVQMDLRCRCFPHNLSHELMVISMLLMVSNSWTL